jgi:mannose-6-phosphate isomerase-like protein (cupin superfamily)
MKKFLPLLILVPVFAADPPGFAIWKMSDIKAHEKQLAGKMNDKKMASETLETFGNHYTMLAHREGDGEVEVHEKFADVFFVESGEATLVVGGKVVGGRTSGPGEIRGTSIDGGEKKMLGAGDIVHIPATVPHLLLVANGKKFTYFVVKIEEKK